MNKSKQWIVFYLCDWQELVSITVEGATVKEIAETRKLLARENNVPVEDIKIKIENRAERGVYL